MNLRDARPLIVLSHQRIESMALVFPIADIGAMAYHEKSYNENNSTTQGNIPQYFFVFYSNHHPQSKKKIQA